MLNGKTRSRPRARIQRLVDSGTHVWIGPRTVREVIAAERAVALTDLIVKRESAIFDTHFSYPNLEAHPELPGLPFNYPLPYDLLRHYAI